MTIAEGTDRSIAYAYVTRHLSTSPLSSLDHEDPDYQEAKSIFIQLVPFLTARRSQTLYQSLEEAITDMWSRFEIVSDIIEPFNLCANIVLVHAKDKIDTSLMSLLLHDTAHLLRPQMVTILLPKLSAGDSTLPPSHPNATSIRVLSDISGLFSSPQRQNHKTLKLSYYATHVLSTPPPILVAMSNELVVRANGMKNRDIDRFRDISLRHESTGGPHSYDHRGG